MVRVQPGELRLAPARAGVGAERRRLRRSAVQRFRSADHYVTFFRSYFGPTIAAFERVGPEGEDALAADLVAFVDRYNRAGDRAVVLESEYVEVVATRA